MCSVAAWNPERRNGSPRSERRRSTPEREIVDPHHHLWPSDGALPYGVDDLVADTGAGHNIVQTVFIECGASYRTEGPEHLAPVGETEFVAAAADDLAARHPDAAPIVGIVAHADLAHPEMEAILDAHDAASGDRFRGIRDSLAHALEPDAHMIPGRYGEGKSENPAFRSGLARLGERGSELRLLVVPPPDRRVRCPGPRGAGDDDGAGSLRYAGGRREVRRSPRRVFEQWKHDIAEVAACGNTIAKLGGLAMPDNGFGYHLADRPPTSDRLLADQRRWYEHTIECFGPERCMFESNFPVDRFSLSYTVYWNAMQKLAAPFSDAEQAAMFSGTARRVYRLSD